MILGADGIALHEQGGYGRVTDSGVRLSPEEALYLLHRGKIDVKGYDFDSFLAACMDDASFLRRFLVYRDIRERGFIIQPGPHDFRVFRRGDRPGKGRSLYLLRVISERQLIVFDAIREDVDAAVNMRKQFVVAVVDDEDELTYYEVKVQALKPANPPIDVPPVPGRLVGTTVIAPVPPGHALEEFWFGTRLDEERLMISPLEAVYLLDKGILALEGTGGDVVGLMHRNEALDHEMREKAAVYAHLRDLGYTARTAYKFGHHFRVYSGKQKHSEMLVHAIPHGSALPMSVISRSVRLAHSVRKKMLFACVHENTISYMEFARIKL